MDFIDAAMIESQQGQYNKTLIAIQTRLVLHNNKLAVSILYFQI